MTSRLADTVHFYGLIILVAGSWVTMMAATISSIVTSN